MLRLITFGGLTLLRDNEPVSGALSQRARLSLLAVLAVAGNRGASRDALIALFWPETDAEHARRALNQNIYGTRRYLGSDDVILGTSDLRLNPAVSSDVAEFQAAVKRHDWPTVAALYAGPFLDGIHIRGSAGFEQWISAHRADYFASYVNAVETLAREARAGGDAAAAAAWWRRLATLDVLNPRYATELMTALAEVGRQGEALAHFRVHAAAVREELGAEPDRAVLSARQKIEKGVEIAAAPHGGSSGAAQGVTVSVEPADVSDGDIPAPNAAGVERDSLAVVRPSPRQRIRFLRAMGAILLLVVIAASIAALWRRADPAPATVIVVPFDNMTGDSDLDVFGSLVADWTAAGLGDLEWVRMVVAPYSPEFVARGGRPLASHERALSLAKARRITLALSGSYTLQRDTLIIQPVLIDSRSNIVVRRIPAVRTLSSNLPGAAEEVRQVIGGSLANLLDRRLAVLRSPADPPPRYEAYRLYISGLERFQSNDFAGSYESFGRARAADTSFILPLIWQVLTRSGDSTYADSLLTVLRHRRDHLPPLERAATDYLEAAIRWDLLAMIDAASRAADLAPGSNWSFHLGDALLRANRPAEAVAALDGVDAEAWVGRWTGYWEVYAKAAHMSGDDALNLRIIGAARARGVGPDPTGPRTLVRWEAAAYAARGDRDALLRLLDRLSARPDPEMKGWALLHVIQELHWHRELKLRDEMRARLLDWTKTREDTTTITGMASLLTSYAAAEMHRETWETGLRLRNALPATHAQTGRLVLTLGRLGVSAAKLGMSNVALAYADSIAAFDEQRGGQRSYATFLRARVMAALGRKAEAVALLSQSAAEGQSQVFDHLAVFADLEDYPPFWELRKPIRPSRWETLRKRLEWRR